MQNPKIHNPDFITFADGNLKKRKKRNLINAKKYVIVERASGRIIAREVSVHANPAHDAFLKGYNLFRNKAIFEDALWEI